MLDLTAEDWQELYRLLWELHSNMCNALDALMHEHPVTERR